MSNRDPSPTSRRIDTSEGAAEPAYEHPITLVDSTLPQPNSNEGSRSSSANPGSRKLAKAPTKSSLKDHFARRRYAKWQEETTKSKSKRMRTENNDTQNRPPISRTGTSERPLTQDTDTDTPAQTETADFAAHSKSPDRGREPALDASGAPKHKHKEQESEIDILYENQRGLFFFGIPLYSHSSLLNLDPAPWITKDLKDSAVNITNAQVPDPSWEWAWKTWYVDMSYDVDEEGWQYSFSFGRQWSWHGTHPWFHSYVRRRRWLRKRVKRHGDVRQGKEGTMGAGHVLSGEYFTIHPKRDRSPASTLAATARISYLSQENTADLDDASEEIQNVPNLLKSLKRANVDREKIEAVKKFVEHGGEELVYLEEQIPEIVSFLVFQTSRRQLLELLKHAADEAQKHRDEHDANDKPEGEAEKRRIDNLLRAVGAANGQIRGLEYWSDRKHALKTSDEPDGKSKAEDEKSTFDGASTVPTEDNPVDEIRGISEKAEIEDDLTHSAVHPGNDEPDSSSAESKGKGKAEEQDEEHGFPGQNSGTTVREPSDRMPADSLIVHDDKQEG